MNVSAVCTATSLGDGENASFTLTVRVGASSGRFVGILSAATRTSSASATVDLPIAPARLRPTRR
jgi:hypothetical protein